MAWAGAVIGLAGGLVSAQGTRQAGRDAEAAFNVNAQIARENADLAREAADDDILSLERLAYRTEGGIRAGYGASGVSATSGSAMDVLADSMAQAALDQNRRRYQGELEARDFMNQARTGQAAGSAARTAGNYGAAAQVLSSVGTAARQYFGDEPPPNLYRR